MKVCFVRSNLPASEPRSLHILEALKEYHPIAILWNRGVSEGLYEKSYRVYEQPTNFGISMLKQLPGWWRFMTKTLRQENPDVVHACNIDSCLAAAWYCWRYRKQLVYDIWDTAGGMYGGTSGPISALLNWIDRGLIKRAALVCTPDSDRLEQLGYGVRQPKNVLILPNSQPFTEYKKRTVTFGSGKLSLLYSGVMATKVRGLEWLIEAADTLAGLELTLVGYGAEEAAIKNLAEASTSGRVHFLGKQPRTKVGTLLGKSDCIVTLLDPSFPNYRFATSTKLFEGFAYGLPVITSAETATARLLEETNWGFVTPFTKEAIFALLKQLLEDKQELVLDPARVKQWDWNNAATELKHAYAQLSR